MPSGCPTVVLISGRGSNLLSLCGALASGQLGADISAVICNEPEASGLEHARRHGLPTETVCHRSYTSRALFDQALLSAIDRYQPKLVVLAGFMRILGATFVNHYLGRLINIHPSLLPRYPGLDTHRRAIEAGDRRHGATVHFVTPDLDAGPSIVQAAVPVLPDDGPDALASRVLAEEHRILPLAVSWFAAGRLELRHNQAWLDGHPITQPLEYRR